MEWKKELWPEWEIVENIGAGAYGTVYKLKRKDIGGVYYSALKVISIPRDEYELGQMRNQQMTETQICDYYYQMVERISKEFTVMERLKGNTNIVSYEDHKIVPHKNKPGWDILIRMELLTSLPEYLKTHDMSENNICKLGIDICNALILCEKEKIIHRDIKPGNIFVSDFGDYKLGDFSLVKYVDFSVDISSPKGTYAYIAPEIYRGAEYDYSADIYSLGLILYRLLNRGRGPFQPLPPEKMTAEIVEISNQKRLKADSFPKPVDASHVFSTIVLKACACNPNKRYKNAVELQKALLWYSSFESAIKVKKQVSSYFIKTISRLQANHIKQSNGNFLYDEGEISNNGLKEENITINNHNNSNILEKKVMNDFFSSAGDL